MSLSPRLNKVFGWFVLVAQCEIKFVVRVSPSQPKTESQSDEYSLVQGTYELSPSDWRPDKSSPDIARTFTFMSLLKKDIFNQQCIRVASDYGVIENPGWVTNRIE